MQTVVKILFVLMLGALGLAAAHGAEEKATVSELKINVRGQPSLVGEVVTQLQRGEQVTVLEYVQNERAKAGEPTNWARIKLPANTPVWVYAPMIKEGTVAASRLNLRAGPGDNYSVIGRLSKGDKVNQIRTMGDWIEIEAPATAYAFVDASLIKPADASSPIQPIAAKPAVTQQQPPATVPTPAPAPPVFQPQTATTTATTTEQPKPVQDALATPTQPQPTREPSPVPSAPVPATSSSPLIASAQPSTPPPAVNHSASAANVSRELPKTTAAPAPASVNSDLPPAKRIVRREGIIRPTRSIQAPTWYELVHPETKKTIDYLYEERLGIKLKPYKGQKVIVSGEEAIDPRWPNTPILELQTLDIAP